MSDSTKEQTEILTREKEIFFLLWHEAAPMTDINVVIRQAETIEEWLKTQTIMKSGILDKNKKEIQPGNKLRWKHFNGHTRNATDMPEEDEFQTIERVVEFKKGALGVQITEDHFEPLANWHENNQLFHHTYFGSSGEMMHVTANVDFEIIP